VNKRTSEQFTWLAWMTADSQINGFSQTAERTWDRGLLKLDKEGAINQPKPERNKIVMYIFSHRPGYL